MAVYEVSLNSEQLSGLLTSDTGLQGLVETVLNQVLEAQVSDQIGAKPYERSEQRQAYRNGSRPRTLYSRVGHWCCMCRRCATAVSARSCFHVINVVSKPWCWR